MHRLFVALTPPEAMRDTLLDCTDGGPDNVRWEPDERLHVTLRFIGEVDRRVADDVADALAQVRGAPLPLGIAGVGRFDHGRSGMLWAKVAPVEPVAHLHRKIDHALVRAGLRPEGRAFVPHITLGRWSRGAIDPTRWLLRHADLRAGPVVIDHFALFESRLGHEGPNYEEVARFPLDRLD